MTPERRAQIANRLAGLGVSGPATDRRDIADLLAALAEREQQIAAVRAIPMETYTAAYDLANDVLAALDSAPKAAF